MRFAIAVVTTFVLCYVSGLFFPWWTIALVGLAVGYFFPERPVMVFVAGFLGCFLLWSVIAIYIDLANDHILASRVGALFNIKQGILMILLTGFVGGLVTAMSALTGVLLKLRLKKLMTA